jgi:hypothetical protein
MENLVKDVQNVSTLDIHLLLVAQKWCIA